MLTTEVTVRDAFCETEGLQSKGRMKNATSDIHMLRYHEAFKRNYKLSH